MEYGRLMRHDIKIEATQNQRAIVRVGCGTFALNSADEVVEFIGQYLKDPQSIRDQCNNGLDQPIGPEQVGDTSEEVVSTRSL